VSIELYSTAAAAPLNSALPAFFTVFEVFLETEDAGVLVVGLVAVMMNFLWLSSLEFVKNV
jgi:hypothetical protein